MSRADWEVVIGLETHVQLSTQSKIFSGSSTAFGAEPNRQASAIDIALPGVLPVLNRGAVERAIRFGLAIGAKVAPTSIFARKNYFYPDLPKGYQISQYELPVVQGGTITVQVGEGDKAYEKVIELTRAHLEEDAGKSLHEDFHGMSGIDLNRAGTPLLEIVTEPVMRSSDEAVAYARALHSLVRWIDISDGNMQEGSFRCDANVSVRKKGTEKLGTRREVKNLNSFRFLKEAIEAEIAYQIETLEDGGTIQQATVLFDPDAGETRAMRSKEDAQDYRYFPDPDLLPLVISDEWIARVKGELPELPAAKKARYQNELMLLPQDAEALTSSLDAATYFENTLSALREIPGIPYLTQTPDVANAKHAANWIINNVAAALNREQLSFAESKVTPEQLAGLLANIFRSVISGNTARKVFDALWSGEGASADEVIEKQGLKQVTDLSAIEPIIDEVLAANQKSVEEFRAGKEKAFNALVGQVMKASKGKASPAQVNELLKKKLGA
ncbi:Asp-tRNA(Asn)/Glu-tRNA(Gln) amidotransferase subunit GatB [Niveibacterium sp.]|uniref:Asp-tRNA(Asn)/Glu-tRNA(Gln) amidotransferase subunit GatB n=1 Tax=Niveibacterium sp. TaxID=2017444 RepID=UPI0035B3049B